MPKKRKKNQGWGKKKRSRSQSLGTTPKLKQSDINTVEKISRLNDDQNPYQITDEIRTKAEYCLKHFSRGVVVEWRGRTEGLARPIGMPNLDRRLDEEYPTEKLVVMRVSDKASVLFPWNTSKIVDGVYQPSDIKLG